MSKAIFWDFDGTLIHPNESFRDSLITACKQNGINITKDYAKKIMREICSWYKPEESFEGKVGDLWWSYLLNDLEISLKSITGDSDLDVILSSFKNNVINYKYKKYWDAKSILRYTKTKGFNNYIISSNFPELVEVSNRLDFSNFLDDFYLSSLIGYEKPRQELFQYAYDKSGKPDICYMIGDNPMADMKGGKTVGMKTVLVHNIKKKNEYCDFVVKSLGMIKKIL